MSTYVLEWLNLGGRWIHLITGIAWIGSSFYFVWLDNHLLRPAAASDAARGVGGELWSVHGGGFYRAQKYPVSPPALPRSLHWFYWEAYSTLISGVFLLGLLYFVQAEVYLIDPSVAALSKPVAIAIACAFLVGGWVLYDALCRTPLARHGAALGAVLAALLSVAAWGLCALFSGRAAFVLFGAMLGSIMVANVFFVIIPGQRGVVAALRAGTPPDALAGQRGKLRSVHNTYFTLPVLFTMLSNHYAFLFGAHHNFAVLIAMTAAGALIRVWFVERHKAHERGGRTAPWPVIAGLALIAVVAIVLAPVQRSPASKVASSERALEIVTARCVGCHAAQPTVPGFVEAPKGLRLETDEQLRTHLQQVALQIRSRAMPIGNLTRMTDEERAEFLDWADHGAAR